MVVQCAGLQIALRLFQLSPEVVPFSSILLQQDLQAPEKGGLQALPYIPMILCTVSETYCRACLSVSKKAFAAHSDVQCSMSCDLCG